MLTRVPASPLSRRTASSRVMPSVRFSLDLQDRIAGLQTGPIGGAADDRAEDVQLAPVHRDLDADAAELVLDAGLEPAQFVGADVVGIRVELVQARRGWPLPSVRGDRPW